MNNTIRAGMMASALAVGSLTLAGCSPVETVKVDEIGVLYNNVTGKAESVLEPGWQGKVPGEQSIIRLPGNPDKIDIGWHKDPNKASLAPACTTKDQVFLEHGMDVDVNYKLVPKEAPALITDFGSYDNFKQKFYDISRASVREVCATYSLPDLEGQPVASADDPGRTTRDKFAEDLQARVQHDLTTYMTQTYGPGTQLPVILIRPNLRQVYTPDYIQQARQDTQVAAQKVLTAQNELEAERKQQQKLVAAAEAQRDAARVNVETAKLKNQAAQELGPNAMQLELYTAIGQSHASVVMMQGSGNVPIAITTPH